MPQKFALLIACSLLALFVCACSNTDTFVFSIEEMNQGRFTTDIYFVANKPVRSIEIYDTGEQLLIRQPIPDLREARITVPAFSADGSIKILAYSTGGHTADSLLELDDYDNSPVALRSPFGQGKDDSVLITPGSETLLFLTLHGSLGDPFKYWAAVGVDGPIELRSKESSNSSNGLTLEGSSAAFVRPVIRQIILEAPDGAAPGDYRITVRVLFETGRNLRSLYLKKNVSVVDQYLIREAVEIVDIVMPATAEGRQIGGMKTDYLSVGREEGLTSQTSKGGGPSPVSFQRITLKNRLEIAVPVVLSAGVVDGDKGEIKAFRTPESQPGTEPNMAVVLPPDKRIDVTLPIFLASDEVSPGRYTRRVTVQMAGSGLVLEYAERPLEVGKPSGPAIAVTILAISATIIAFGFVFLRGNSFLSRFTTRQIVLISLISSASVVLVNLPVFFVSSITFVLLGPLGFLVDSLLTEFLYGALLVALLIIIRKQGVCALVAGIRFLLGGVLLGMLTPIGAIHTVISAVSLEAAVWLSGVLRWGKGGRPGMRLVLLFASANALISWIGFQLSIVLFRLHYADWYIALSVLVGGFAYSLLGAIAGRSVGWRLAHVTS